MRHVAGQRVTFGILGPLLVEVGGRPVRLGGPRQRSVLALLLLRSGQVVPVNHIIDALWEGRPPPAAESTLRGYVSLLRRALNDATGVATSNPLATRPSGYQLDIDADQVDASQFERLFAKGRQLMGAGDYSDAAQSLRAALRLWRGPALADLAAEPWARAHCVRLEELRQVVIEARVEADLALGRHAELVSELRMLVTEYPLRERLHEQRMLALYRSGRQADALDAYRQAYGVLVREHGIDPGNELRKLERAILRQDRGLDWIPPAPLTAARKPATTQSPVPAELPADIPTFIGRAAPLAELTALLPMISTITGPAGVGKTALAVHWGHQARNDFPDGQLYVNLRGYAPGTPVQPIEALGRFLRGLGLPAEQVPVDVDEAAGRYRSLLADRRVLVVLDNAASADQVRPLLPANPGCLALVTSRDRLPGLVVADGAHPLALDLLTPTEALQLLVRRVGPDRVGTESQAAEEIVARCARLPLALAIVAARAATDSGLSLAALATELRDARTGLDAFASGDAATNVRAVFSWSYRSLTDPAARLFRLLGLHAGPDVATPAAASLAGIPVQEARRLLADLARAHLVDEQRTSNESAGRWTCHDLLRAYATELTLAIDPDSARRAALHRLLDHYLHTAYTAALLLNPLRDPIVLDPPHPGAAPEKLTDAEHAMAWFTAERSVLLAAIDQTSESGLDAHTWQLVWTLFDFFDRRGHWRDWAETHHIALAAAHRLADRPAQALTHRGLGRAYARLGRHDDAHTHFQHALALFDELGDHTGQARTHLNLAEAFEHQGRHREALRHSERALALHRASGHRAGQARALNDVGWYHCRLGDHHHALAYCQQALTLLQALGDRRGQAATWDSLGYAHHHLGQYRQSIDCYQRALTLSRALGDRYNEADTLTRLGDSQHAAGDPDAARASWRRALTILHELGHEDADLVRAKLDAAPGGACG